MKQAGSEKRTRTRDARYNERVTTLRVDSDVYDQVKRYAEKTRISYKSAARKLLLAGLTSADKKANAA